MNVVLDGGVSGGPGRGHALPVLPRDTKRLPVTYKTCMEKTSTIVGSEGRDSKQIAYPIKQTEISMCRVARPS